MRPDDHSRKSSTKKERRAHEHWRDPHGAQSPRSWTSKTMHHPATRIGEIKHGKS
jgi:hypothetical protein